ncbi:MAG: hypothetical protein V1863_07595, partial [Candidatus Omnitrophota bacterium]
GQVSNKDINKVISQGFGKKIPEVVAVQDGIRNPVVRDTIIAFQGRGDFANDVNAYQAALKHAREGKIYIVTGDAATRMREMGIDAHNGRQGIYIRDDIFTTYKIAQNTIAHNTFAHEISATLGRPHDYNIGYGKAIEKWQGDDAKLKSKVLAAPEAERGPPQKIGELPDKSPVFEQGKPRVSDYASTATRLKEQFQSFKSPAKLETRIREQKASGERLQEIVGLREDASQAINKLIDNPKYDISANPALKPYAKVLRVVASEIKSHIDKYNADALVKGKGTFDRDLNQFWLIFAASYVGAYAQKHMLGDTILDPGVVFGANCSLGKTEAFAAVANSILRLTNNNKAIIISSSNMELVNELLNDNVSMKDLYNEKDPAKSKVVKLTEPDLYRMTKDRGLVDAPPALQKGKIYLTDNNVMKRLDRQGALKSLGKDLIYISDEIQAAAASSKLVDAKGIRWNELIQLSEAGGNQAKKAGEALKFSERAMKSCERLYEIAKENVGRLPDREAFTNYTDNWRFKTEIQNKIIEGYKADRNRNPESGLVDYSYTDLRVLLDGLAWAWDNHATGGKHYKVHDLNGNEMLGYSSRDVNTSRVMLKTQLGDEGRGLNARASFLALRLAHEKGLKDQQKLELFTNNLYNFTKGETGLGDIIKSVGVTIAFSGTPDAFRPTLQGGLKFNMHHVNGGELNPWKSGKITGELTTKDYADAVPDLVKDLVGKKSFIIVSALDQTHADKLGTKLSSLFKDHEVFVLSETTKNTEKVREDIKERMKDGLKKDIIVVGQAILDGVNLAAWSGKLKDEVLIGKKAHMILAGAALTSDAWQAFQRVGINDVLAARRMTGEATQIISSKDARLNDQQRSTIEAYATEGVSRGIVNKTVQEIGNSLLSHHNVNNLVSIVKDRDSGRDAELRQQEALTRIGGMMDRFSSSGKRGLIPEEQLNRHQPLTPTQQTEVALHMRQWERDYGRHHLETSPAMMRADIKGEVETRITKAGYKTPEGKLNLLGERIYNEGKALSELPQAKREMMARTFALPQDISATLSEPTLTVENAVGVMIALDQVGAQGQVGTGFTDLSRATFNSGAVTLGTQELVDIAGTFDRIGVIDITPIQFNSWLNDAQTFRTAMAQYAPQAVQGIESVAKTIDVGDIIKISQSTTNLENEDVARLHYGLQFNTLANNTFKTLAQLKTEMPNQTIPLQYTNVADLQFGAYFGNELARAKGEISYIGYKGDTQIKQFVQDTADFFNEARRINEKAAATLTIGDLLSNKARDKFLTNISARYPFGLKSLNKEQNEALARMRELAKSKQSDRITVGMVLPMKSYSDTIRAAA